MATKQASLLLKKQMIELSKNASESFSAGLVDDDIYKWEVIIMGPPDTEVEKFLLFFDLVFTNHQHLLLFYFLRRWLLQS